MNMAPSNNTVVSDASNLKILCYNTTHHFIMK